MDLCPAITDSETMANRQLIPWARLSVICLPIAAIAACEGGDDTRDERESKTMLEVYRTVAQPTDPAIGTNMEIRARGGLRVAISTHPGTHFVAGAALQGQADSCVGVPQDSSPLAVIVKPDATETLLYVALYPGEACVGTPLRTVATSVTTTRPGPADEGGSDADSDAALDAEAVDAAHVDATSDGPSAADAGGEQ
jgi:hypothetical protein